MKMRFHSSLPVRNIDRTVAFYSALFGTEPVKVRSDYAKFLPGTPDINLTFHAVEPGADLLTGLHLGFEFADQPALDEAYSRMKAAGWVTEERDTSVCCYANQDKFWITDPSGYRWELYRLVNDADSKFGDTGESTCCKPSQATADHASSSCC